MNDYLIAIKLKNIELDIKMILNSGFGVGFESLSNEDKESLNACRKTAKLIFEKIKENTNDLTLPK